MKKTLILALALPLSASLCACATNEFDSVQSESEITSEVSSIDTIETTSESKSETSSISSSEVEEGYYYFGRYPQTIKDDDVTIVEGKGSNLFLGSDGEEYISVTANPYGSQYVFSNGETVAKDTVYYFKVEPICWKILQQDEETMFLHTLFILDAKQFYSSRDNRTIDGNTIYPNNYEYSDIRKWINDDFYSFAFNSEEKSQINVSQVDNSASTTTEPANQYCCSDTEDKVFLLSAKEVCAEEYGYGKDDAANRVKALTDYAIAIGGFYASPENKGIYLLRSPSNMNEINTSSLTMNSYVNLTTYVDDTYTGIAPAIKISL